MSRLTTARLRILASADPEPPHVVRESGARTGFDRVAWRRNRDWLAANGYLEPNAHGDHYATQAGLAAARDADV